MSQFSFARTSPKVLCLTAALVLGTGAAIAYAATTTSAAGVISACSNKSTGQLRVLAAGAACDTKKETPISWNIQGIQGIQGPQGIQGLTGATGAQGIQGEKGDTGAAASTSVTVRTNSGVDNSVQILCDPGQVAVGGGYEFGDTTVDTGPRELFSSAPFIDNTGRPTGWFVEQKFNVPVTVHVICIQ